MEAAISTRYKKYVRRENRYLKKLLKNLENKKRYDEICKKAAERKEVLKKQGYFENHKVESLEEAQKIVDQFHKVVVEYVEKKKAEKKKGILNRKTNPEAIGRTDLLDPTTIKDMRSYVINEDSTFLSDDELDNLIDKAYIAIKDVHPAEIRLTIIAALYIGLKINPEQFYKYIDAGNFVTEMEFLNSVFKFMDNIPLKPQYNTYMINEAFNTLADFQKIVTFMYDSDIFNNPDDMDMSSLLLVTRERLEKFMLEEMRSNEGKENVDVATPVRFSNRNLDFADAAGIGISRGMLNKLEKVFGALLLPYAGQYKFNKIGDMIELVISTDTREDQYIIDPCLVIGNGYQMVHNQGGYTRFIKIEEGNADIISKLLADRNYKLTDIELMRSDREKFMNQVIYRDIDMSKGPEIFPKLTNEEMNVLAKKFTFILNLPWANSPTESDTRIVFGRCRIRNFKSVNDFTLVSDNKVKCPMDICRNYISNGLTIKITDDTVTVLDKTSGKREEYTIEKYNEM